jgi:hypothetical protein
MASPGAKPHSLWLSLFSDPRIYFTSPLFALAALLKARKMIKQRRQGGSLSTTSLIKSLASVWC